MSYPEARYLGDEGKINATFRPVGRKPELTIGSSTAVPYLATGASTHGQFGLYKWDARPRTPGPSAHFHKTISESFFILSGTLRLFNGERWIDATAGDFLYVPEGGVHGFHNESDEPASLLLLFAPGGRVRRTSKHSPKKPQVAGSATRSGTISAAAMTTTLSDQR